MARGDTEQLVPGWFGLSLILLAQLSQLSPIPGSIGSCLAIYQVPSGPTSCGLWSRGLFPPFFLFPLSPLLLLPLLQLSRNAKVKYKRPLVRGAGEEES
jgi:hypothetical protein